MKAVVLCSGKGTRLYPLTKTLAKALISINNKKAIYYSLELLKECNIKDILLIINEKDYNLFDDLLKNELDINITYKIQKELNGPLEAYKLSKDFIKDDSSILLYSDNLFKSKKLIEDIKSNISNFKGAKIYLHDTLNPESYGICTLNNNKIIDIEEKPKHTKSNKALTGIYLFDNKVFEYSKNISEIKDLLLKYLSKDELNYLDLEKDIWIDFGTPDNLLKAEILVKEK